MQLLIWEWNYSLGFFLVCQSILSSKLNIANICMLHWPETLHSKKKATAYQGSNCIKLVLYWLFSWLVIISPWEPYWAGDVPDVINLYTYVPSLSFINPNHKVVVNKYRHGFSLVMVWFLVLILFAPFEAINKNKWCENLRCIV